MPAAVRDLRPGDARAFLEVHHNSVRGIASDYPAEVIEAWAPLPITEKHVEAFLSNPDGEFRLVAELGNRIVGVGALVIARGALRACYVAPEAGRRGVGSMLVREIERVARAHGLLFLEVDSSVNAEPFYAAHGYGVYERGEHVLGTGQRMACVRMGKSLLMEKS